MNASDVAMGATINATSFTFLGFTFGQRGARNRRGQTFSGFLPARSDAAQMKMNATARSWRLHYKTTLTLAAVARWINPIVKAITLHTPGGISRTPSRPVGSPGPAPSPPAARPPAKPRT
jgi:hypothetical protein